VNLFGSDDFHRAVGETVAVAGPEKSRGQDGITGVAWNPVARACGFRSFGGMDSETLARSAAEDASEPTGLTVTERALWLARAGRWHEAHDLCSDVPEPAGSWIHAWLHREEGDYGNACYWYSRAGKAAKAADDSLEDEWFEIARDLLDQ
jgi:hypothetical protein